MRPAMAAKPPSWRRRGRRAPRPEDEERFALLTQNSLDVIMRHSPAGITYVSPAAREIFGVEPESMLGRRLRHYVVDEDRAALISDSTRMYAGGPAGSRFRFRIRRPDGAVRWVEVNRRAEIDRTGRPTGSHVTVLRDVTETQELEAKLAAMALLDGLTGISNRLAFDQALQRAWRGAVRQQSNLSLLMLDIDHFKTFNDSYGHQAGDDCLRAVARAVADAVKRPQDFAARYGGEELAVILPGTDGTGAVDVAERILDAVRELKIPHESNQDGGGFVSASIGGATAVMYAGGMAGTPALLLNAADEALYEAKNRGRNRTAMGPVMMVAVSEDES